MEQYQGRTRHPEMDAIEQNIRESVKPDLELSKIIMNKIGENEMSRVHRIRAAKNTPGMLKKTAVAAAVAGVLGAGILGAGFVSPVMADTLKRIPGIGILYQGTSPQSVELAMSQGILSQPGLSVTHDGVTLKLTDLLYDGTRLSFQLEHEGGLDLSGEATMGQLIESPVVLADGQKIKFTSGGFGDIPYQDNAYRGELTGDLNLPDAFTLTIQVKVKQVNETFEFTAPVKIMDNALVVTPNITKTEGSFSYTVEQLKVTPVSTRLVLSSQGEVPQSAEQSGDYHASMMYYELVDDQGNSMDPNQYGFYNSRPKTEYHLNELYPPFAATPKTITIKPYTLTVKNDDFSIVGQKHDSIGNFLPGRESKGTRTYLKNLETTITLQP
ncbi:DUF4179 domain-containing protein [Paenibacillus piscarius]|uniref:DUF4179 domain-containing protein n=1 Tax=Paenibacillus piscarius TaxID=1089681 RepID=UPI001EE88D0E|nr:DUF4179 domain-containing protein [Paenibacillus piscarius]